MVNAIPVVITAACSVATVLFLVWHTMRMKKLWRESDARQAEFDKIHEDLKAENQAYMDKMKEKYPWL